MSFCFRIFAIVAALALAGCKQEVYSNLSEVEANQMLAILTASGMPVEKASKGKDGFTIEVEQRDLLRAIALLKDAGYPKSPFVPFSKTFEKSGMMSSPFEERVRYIHALGDDVAQTLSQIDGVISARVRPGMEAGSALPLTAHDGGQYVAYVMPLRSVVRTDFKASLGAAATVFVRKVELDGQNYGTLVARAYGLTPAEARVLLAIVEVGGVPETSERLGVAETTVKTHLYRVFSKTGASRQADLVKLAAAFSNPLAG